ncbi:MAG: type II CRISPR RNA-guided endonuclease Cas9 [Rhodobacteraceae bacterium]|nr:type II CRISPR RNA-guided endonuclease Cas9 [Paracoccaceae bacterium]
MHALDGKKHTKSISGMSIKLKTLGREIDLAPEETFTLETGNRDAVDCDRVRASLSHPDRFGHQWVGMDAEEQWEVVDKLRNEEDQDILVGWLMTKYELDRKHAETIASAPLPEGYSRLGETATRRVLEMLESDVLTYSEAVKACGWHHSDLRTGEVLDELPYYGAVLDRHVIPGTKDPKDDDITRYGRIANPTVHIGLNQLRRLVNRIIRVHGKPDQIVVELARELKQSAEQKLKTQRRLKETTEAAIRRGEKLEELRIANTGGNRMILRLWEELGQDPMMRKCPYSGRRISPTMLFDGSCDVDHILPYSRTLDDSPANRTLCLKEANRAKRNQTPWEAWGRTEKWGEISANIKNLPGNKQWRFAPDAMTRFEEKRDFLDRALVDTQYLSRLARTYLDTLYADSEQHVWVIPGRLTEMFRRHWGLNWLLTDHNKNTNKAKDRTDHRHHAVDAAVIAATDRSLLNRVSKAAGRHEEQGAENVVRTTDPPWKGFREEIGAQLERIIVSHRADHGRIDLSARVVGRDSTSGKLHNDTAYGLTGESQNGVPLVVSRKPLDALNPASLGKIRDPQLRQCLKTATQGKTGKDFKEALVEFARTSSRYRGVRRVRIVEPVNVIEVEDGAGRAYKGYKPDSNHCYEVWELPTGEWVPQVLTTFEAHLEQVPRKPHPAARRIMRLYKKDTLYLSHPKHGDVVATIGQLGIQRLDLVPHNEADADARNRDKTDPFSFIRVSVGTLKRSQARRVYVDEMGRLRDPGPPRI